jgi:putative NADH-flavin reductase
MNIALFGSTGQIGSRLLAEATDRGHAVTVVVRDPAKAPARAAAVVTGDVTDAKSVAETVVGHDAVISAVGGVLEGQDPVAVQAARALIEGLSSAGVDRLLVVGGAGSLLTPDGVRLIDQPGFPEHVKPFSMAQVDALEIYRSAAAGLRWTFLSPADEIEPGERTGRFVLGDDEAVYDANGRSHISMEDYAVALVDELETPRHLGRRFTLGYVDA